MIYNLLVSYIDLVFKNNNNNNNNKQKLLITTSHYLSLTHFNKHLKSKFQSKEKKNITLHVQWPLKSLSK